jgi:hypothetical protein
VSKLQWKLQSSACINHHNMRVNITHNACKHHTQCVCCDNFMKYNCWPFFFYSFLEGGLLPLLPSPHTMRVNITRVFWNFFENCWPFLFFLFILGREGHFIDFLWQKNRTNIAKHEISKWHPNSRWTSKRTILCIDFSCNDVKSSKKTILGFIAFIFMILLFQII